MSDEQGYYQSLREDAVRVAEAVDEGEYPDEAAEEMADSEMVYYWKARRCIRWTDNLDAIDEIGMPDGSAMEVIQAIAVAAYTEDLKRFYEREYG